MSDSWDDLYTCPICGTDDCVPAAGKEDSPVLILGAFPGNEELKYGKPMVGRNGTVLAEEFRRANISISQCRITNLWGHAPNENAGCLAHWAKLATKEAKGRKGILIVGAEAVKYFCNCSVEKYNGLLVKSPFLSCPIIMPMIQPVNVFAGGLGEVRLTIQKFARLVEEYW